MELIDRSLLPDPHVRWADESDEYVTNMIRRPTCGDSWIRKERGIFAAVEPVFTGDKAPGQDYLR